MKNRWLQLTTAGLMLFVTIGFIFTPNLPFSDNIIVEKAIEYAVHGLYGILAFSLFLFAMGRYKLMFLGLSCVAALCIFLKSQSNDHLMLIENKLAPKLEIVHFNLANIDDSYDDFYRRLIKMDADIISLQELTPNWDLALRDSLAQVYPYVIKNVRIDPFGKALFSKQELIKKQIVGENEDNYLSVNLKMGDQIISLSSNYILPPLNESSKLNAKNQLETISKKIRSSVYPSIAIGDLNMVHWSNLIRLFTKDAKLKNSRRGFSVNGFEIPYDHMFFTEDLECAHFEEILDENSTHMGIRGTFQIKEELTEEEIRASLGYLKK